MNPLLAISAQQKIGVGVVVLVLVGWVAYLFTQVKRRDRSVTPGSEIETAANRRIPPDDEVMEGPRLERALGWALILLIIVGIGLPIYWLREPGRQAGASVGFEERSVERGHSLFQPTDSPEHGAHFGCATCHGSEGQGGVASYNIDDDGDGPLPVRSVQWQAPAINTATLRYDDEELRAILVYGRANSPMPAWGVEGGGPMNDQQIEDLISYMRSLELDAEQVKKDALATYGTDGPTLFNNYCARCHTKGWSYGEPDPEPGSGAFGPNLTNGSTLKQFPAVEDHVEFIQQGSEYAEEYGERGVGGNESGGMPGFSNLLTDEQIRAIVDYERTM